MRTFAGGIHPNDGKKLTMDKPITKHLPKEDAVYPLSQHIGAPATPVVKKGDQVLVGQLIAEASGFMSANIHSSVSGTVKIIEPRLTASGMKVNSIIITNDEEYKTIEYKPNNKKISELSKEEILDAIKNAGIVGMGGAGFPAHIKLTPKNADQIDTIIINAAECEPYLTSDYRRLLEEGDEVIEGLEIVLSLFPGAKGIIAIEDNKPKVIKLLKDKLIDNPDITVKVLKTKYPQGAERQLIYAATGRYINSTMLPADAGCIVHNVDTIYSIQVAVRIGKPLITRVVTISGDAIANPCNIRARIGTSYNELIEAAGGFSVEPEKIISGGPMMGKAIYNTDIPVTKGTSAILCFAKDDVTKSLPGPCIRCGRCVKICPGRVVPTKLAQLAKEGNIEEFIKNDGMECCECGSCSYICPAKIHLTQTIAATRKAVLANKKK